MNNQTTERPIENNNRALTPREPQERAIATKGGVLIGNMNDLARFAKMVFDSGLAPKGFESPQKIGIAIEMGLEMGLTPMMALQNIAVINGKPGIYGDAAKALVEASGLMADYEEHPGLWCDLCEREGDAKNKCPKCGQSLSAAEHHGFIVSSLRLGRKNRVITGFNIRQAKKANLWGKAGPWTNYPNRMLMFRARGFNLRDNFPDVLKGFKTVEELSDYPARATAVVMDNIAPPEPHAEAPAAPPQQVVDSQPASQGRKASKKTLSVLKALCDDLSMQPPQVESVCRQAGVETLEQLTEENAQTLISDLAKSLELKKQGDGCGREPGVDEE